MQDRFHNFYAEKKDPKVVSCLFDTHQAREQYDLAALTNTHLLQLFMTRVVTKSMNNFDICIFVFKPTFKAEVLLKMPYVWQNFRDHTFLLAGSVVSKGLPIIYDLKPSYVDQKNRYKLPVQL